MYNALNFSLSAGYAGQTPANTTVLNAKLATMLCPSENLTNPSAGGGWKNYVANVGGPPCIGAWTGAFSVMQSDARGPTTVAAQYLDGNCGVVGLQSVIDGTSNTALFSETYMGSGPAANAVTISSTKRPTTYLFPTGQNAPIDQGVNGGTMALSFVNVCKNLPGTTPGFGGLGPANGNVWIAGNGNSTMMWDSYNHWMPPNSVGCDNQADGNTGGWGNIVDAMPPSSNHSGGVNVGMCDGSVKFVKNTVSLQAWWALGTRNMGEIISSDAL
jgi:prepilin-type processing-associated H-X9-DG protein